MLARHSLWNNAVGLALFCTLWLLAWSGTSWLVSGLLRWASLAAAEECVALCLGHADAFGDRRMTGARYVGLPTFLWYTDDEYPLYGCNSYSEC